MLTFAYRHLIDSNKFHSPWRLSSAQRLSFHLQSIITRSPLQGADLDSDFKGISEPNFCSDVVPKFSDYYSSSCATFSVIDYSVISNSKLYAYMTIKQSMTP